MAIATQIEQIPVTCVRFSGPGPRRFEAITHIGGGGPGQRWEWTRTQVVQELKSPAQRYAFYVFDGRRRAYVRIYRLNGVEYIRTEADGIPTNNLESLDICP